MTRTVDYATLTDEQRNNALINALEQMHRAQDRYAALCAGEAALAVRRHYPTADRVRFDIEEADGEYTAELVSVRDAEDRLLWLADDLHEPGRLADLDDDAYDTFHDLADDTEITDRLVTARIHGAEFPPVREPGREGEHRVAFELHIPTALTEAARAR